MLDAEKVNGILGISESYEAPARMLELMLDDVRRQKIFKDFLAIEHDLNYEWFLNYFQNEHAERKTKKQDFTPNSISKLLTEMVEGGSGYYEVAAGTGSLLIKAWQKHREDAGVIQYDPRGYWYEAEELSDRTVPFLIFNMAIRGMNGVVLHGDSLTREFKRVYFIRNNTSDYMAFSEVIVMPKTRQLMADLDIRKWI